MGFDDVAWGANLEDLSDFDWLRAFPLTVEVGDNWSIVSDNTGWQALCTYVNPPWGLANPVPSTVFHSTLRRRYRTPSTSLPRLGVVSYTGRMDAHDVVERRLWETSESWWVAEERKIEVTWRVQVHSIR